ncbi:NFACT family protein [Candidatus Micrarchaeota archaeon]|nr:NFACT family protein [Candidatus Micrarchaeota archaeon]
MHLINLSLAYLVQELKPLIENSLIKKIQEISNDTYKVKLHTREGSKTLLISPSTINLTDYKIQAKQTTSGFGAFLKKRLEGKRIQEFSQHNFDRVVEIKFTEFNLIIELFAKGNLILTDKDYKIESAYRKEQWADRTLKKSFPYSFPSAKKLNPKTLSLKELKALFNESSKDLIHSLVEGINAAPIIAEEVCFNLKLDKKLAPKKLTEQQLKKIVSSFNSLYSINLKQMNSFKAKKDGKELIIPIELLSVKESTSLGKSINKAIDKETTQKFLLLTKKTETTPVLEEQRKKTKGLEHSLNDQLLALNRFEKAITENKVKAEWLYSNAKTIQDIFDSKIKGKEKGIEEKEIMYKINSFLKKSKEKVIITELKKNKLVVEIT